MGRVSITIYQPIAGLLGHPGLSSLNLQVPVEGTTKLRDAMRALGPYGARLVRELKRGKASKISSIIAVNGSTVHAGMDALVSDGDQVSILPMYDGG